MNTITLDGEVLTIEGDVAYCRHKRPFYTNNTDYIHFQIIDVSDSIQPHDIIVVTGEIIVDPQDDPDLGIVIKHLQIFNSRL